MSPELIRQKLLASVIAIADEENYSGLNEEIKGMKSLSRNSKIINIGKAGRVT